MNKTVRLVLVKKMNMNFNLSFFSILILQWFRIFFAHTTLMRTAHPFHPMRTVIVVLDGIRAACARVKNVIYCTNQNDTVPVVAIVATSIQEMRCSQLAIFAAIVSIADIVTTVLMLIHYYFCFCLNPIKIISATRFPWRSGSAKINSKNFVNLALLSQA